MSDNAEYEGMRSHYRQFKGRATVIFTDTDHQVRVEKEIAGLQKGLMEFCLVNGHDLEELNKFFRDVDSETTPNWPG